MLLLYLYYAYTILYLYYAYTFLDFVIIYTNSIAGLKYTTCWLFKSSNLTIIPRAHVGYGHLIFYNCLIKNATKLFREQKIKERKLPQKWRARLTYLKSMTMSHITWSWANENSLNALSNDPVITYLHLRHFLSYIFREACDF